MTEVFLVGSGRSGTTALFNAMAEGLDVSTVPAIAGRYPLTLVPALLANRAGVRSWLLRPSSEATTLLAQVGLSQSTMLELQRPMKFDDLGQTNKGDLARAVEKVKKWGPAPHLLLKNTANTSRIDVLAKALPNAKFVYIRRDPRAVVNSLLKVGFWNDMPLWWSGKTPAQMEQEGSSSASIAARHWVAQVSAAEDALSDVDSGRVQRISYERLVTKPENTLQELARFLPEIDPRGDGISPLFFRSSSLGSWAESLSASDLEEIAAICAEFMKAYDYS